MATVSTHQTHTETLPPTAQTPALARGGSREDAATHPCWKDPDTTGYTAKKVISTGNATAERSAAGLARRPPFPTFHTAPPHPPCPKPPQPLARHHPLSPRGPLGKEEICRKGEILLPLRGDPDKRKPRDGGHSPQHRGMVRNGTVARLSPSAAVEEVKTSMGCRQGQEETWAGRSRGAPHSRGERAAPLCPCPAGG